VIGEGVSVTGVVVGVDVAGGVVDVAGESVCVEAGVVAAGVGAPVVGKSICVTAGVVAGGTVISSLNNDPLAELLDDISSLELI
jgi:hypothetical protein